MYKFALGEDLLKQTLEPVSYTHLDVYKRQILCCTVSFNTNFVINKQDNELQIKL